MNYKDVMADAKKSNLFKKMAEEARIKILIADEVNRARKKLKMDQGELAKKAGTTQRIISNIESGQINIGASLLSRIAKALDLPSKFGNANLGAGNPLWGYEIAFKEIISLNNQASAVNELIKDNNLIKATNNF